MLLRYAIASCVILLSSATHQVIHAADSYSVNDTEGKHADIVTPDGKVILRYMYDRDTSNPETTFDTAKVFAHVMSADGKTPLTKVLAEKSHITAVSSLVGINSTREVRSMTSGTCEIPFKSIVILRRLSSRKRRKNHLIHRLGGELMGRW